MSRIGKLPILIPKGVDVEINGDKVKVKGPKGELTETFRPIIEVKVADGKVVVKRSDEDKSVRALHGLTRTIIYNMIRGVVEGYRKELQIVGVGYKALKSGKGLQLNVGYSHPVIIQPIKGIEFELEGANKIIISGADKNLVGQTASNIRSIRPPEPYKGKGIKYIDEIIHKKVGKAGKVGA